MVPLRKPKNVLSTNINEQEIKYVSYFYDRKRVNVGRHEVFKKYLPDIYMREII